MTIALFTPCAGLAYGLTFNAPAIACSCMLLPLLIMAVVTLIED